MKNKLIFQPRAGHPMHVIFFASGGPGNIQHAFETEKNHNGLFHIGLVITDRPNIPAIEIAKMYKRECYIYPFDDICGKWKDAKKDPTLLSCYLNARERLHDAILLDIQKYEKKTQWTFDLAVLAYRRLITGKLLHYFQDRMINQHPADLTALNPTPPFLRKYIGIQGLSTSLCLGEKRTRTSTILVKEGTDTGEILCQGPWIEFKGNGLSHEDLERHEQEQKRKSDWPSLSFALVEIARGHFAISVDHVHHDGSRLVFHKTAALPYGGVSIEE